VIALAAWRQRQCVELDRPLGQVLADRQIVELARQRAVSAAQVRATKGLAGFARQRAAEIAEVLATAEPSDVPVLAAGRSPSPRAQRWAEVLLAIVQLVAERAGIAPRLLATRSDAEEFARTVDERGLAAAEPLPALASWRRDVLGEAWRGWLTGALVLVGDVGSPQGVQLVPR